MGGNGGGFKAYNDHRWATDHSAKTNPWVKRRGQATPLGSDEAKQIAQDVAARKQRDAAAAATQNRFVFFDLSMGTRPVGRVVFELWTHSAPCTCASFERMVVGGLGASANAVAPMALRYKGSALHRIAKGVALHGGDIEGADSALRTLPSASSSALDAAARHERHARAGLLSTDGAGRADEPTARFLVTLAAAPQFDGRHVVFGHVRSGMDVLLEVERAPTDESGVPSGAGVRITECGVIAADELPSARAGGLGAGAPTPAGPLTADAARELTEKTVSRVEKALHEGLRRSTAAATPAPASAAPGATPTHKRAGSSDQAAGAEPSEGEQAAAPAKVARTEAAQGRIASKWSAPLDDLSEDDDSDVDSGDAA